MSVSVFGPVDVDVSFLWEDGEFSVFPVAANSSYE
jgi:hypothetical protein